MQFLHTTDQLDLRDGAREFLRQRFEPAALRALVEAGEPASAWGELAELGLTSALVSTDHGGLGLDLSGFALLAEEAGLVALPEPLSDAAGVAVAVLNAVSHPAAAQALQQIAAGEARVLTAHSDQPFVAGLQPGDHLLIITPDTVRLLAPTEVEYSAADSIDPLRSLSRITVDKQAGILLADKETAASLHPLARRVGAVLTAAEQLGLAQAMLDMSTAYVTERKQFGSVIGAFQAIKHHLASALVQLEFARPVVARAAAVAAGSGSEVAVAQAKIAATEAATQTAETAIQVHGAMGYTFEVDLHLWMKRCWALAGQWGDLDHHLNRVDQYLLARNTPLGPGTTFNPEN